MKSSGNFTCHWCRISKNRPRRKAVHYIQCSGCTMSYCESCLGRYLSVPLDSLDQPEQWQCLCCQSLCCCSGEVCKKRHRHCFTYTRTKKRHSDEKVVLDWTEPSAHPEKKVKRAFLDSSAEKASCFDSRTKRTKRRRISSSTGDSAMEMDGEKVASPEPSETSKREQRPRRKLLPATSTESSPQCKVSGTPSHSTQTLLKREVSVVIGSDAEILRDTVSTNPTDMNTSLESNPTASRDESPSESEEIEELAMQLLYSLSGVTTSVDRGSLGASQDQVDNVPDRDMKTLKTETQQSQPEVPISHHCVPCGSDNEVALSLVLMGRPHTITSEVAAVPKSGLSCNPYHSVLKVFPLHHTQLRNLHNVNKTIQGVFPATLDRPAQMAMRSGSYLGNTPSSVKQPQTKVRKNSTTIWHQHNANPRAAPNHLAFSRDRIGDAQTPRPQFISFTDIRNGSRFL